MLPLPQLVALRASEQPDADFVIDPWRGSVTYSEFDLLARRWATAWKSLGLRPGERVVTVLPPSLDALASWIGAAWLGASMVAVNPALRGGPLDRALTAADAAFALCAEGESATLREAAGRTGALRVMTAGGTSTSPHHGEEQIHLAPEEEAYSGPPPRLEDTAVVLFTSGTTGFPKPVVVPWAQLWASSTGHIPPEFLDASDCWYSPFPLFHVSGLFPTYAMAISGGSVRLKERFRTGDFWDDVRAAGCTATLMFGATATFLLDEPAKEDDRDNPLRSVVGFFPRSEEFVQRFGIERHFRAYNQTEVSVPISTAGAVPPNVRTCGRVRAGYEVKLVDSDGRDVAGPGSGELYVRADDPRVLSPGYLGDPVATAARRHGDWHATGDVLSRDEDGWYYFVDRMSDAIRRRGENISSMEIETEAVEHPEVLAAAVIGVPTTDGDQEMLLAVACAPGAALTEPALAEWLLLRLAPFMVPRYLTLGTTLPTTPTGKVVKADIRRSPDPIRVWDRVDGVHVAVDPRTGSVRREGS